MHYTMLAFVATQPCKLRQPHSASQALRRTRRGAFFATARRASKHAVNPTPEPSHTSLDEDPFRLASPPPPTTTAQSDFHFIPPSEDHQPLSVTQSPYFASKEYANSHQYTLLRPVASLVALIVGFLVLPSFARLLAPLGVAARTDQLNVLITGTFIPVIGILFAMLCSTAVSSLRQRQQDLRDMFNQELAVIRMLLVMIKDQSIISLLLSYTLQLESETFGHKENGISYEHERPGTDKSIRREEFFARSEETLWQCVQEANDLRLRSEVEMTIRSLVTFRTKRRAVLDSGLPQIHFIITGLLGCGMLLAFGIIAAKDVPLYEVFSTRLLFGSLLALLSLTFTLLRDLRDPFGGDYGLAPWRLYRTVELLRNRLNH